MRVLYETVTAQIDQQLAHATATAFKGPDDVRRIQVDGLDYVTDLPPDVHPFLPRPPYLKPLPITQGAAIWDNGVRPAALDTLQPGTYTTCGVQLNPVSATEYNVHPTRRRITIAEGTLGRVIAAESFGSTKSWTADQNMTGMHRALGYVIGEAEQFRYFAGIPTPSTVSLAAARLGVHLTLFPEYDVIPAEPYLQAFKDGSFPVSTNHEELYRHDIEDDHLPVIVLGEDPLNDTLKKIAIWGLAGSKAKRDTAAELIDDYTFMIRRQIAKHKTAFLADNKEYLQVTRRARRAGVKRQVTDAIIATARRKAALDYGIKTR